MESKVILTETNPQEKSNFLSNIFLTWSFGLFRKGYKQGLMLNDLWQARTEDKSGRLGDRLEQAWQEEQDNAKKTGTKPSFARAIVRTFWFEYMLCGLVVGLMMVVVRPLVPFTLAIFIDYFSNEKTPETYRIAHIFNFLMNLCCITSAFLYNHTQLSQGRVGMRIRIASCSLMYRKILKLKLASLSKTEPGQVINLMSNDVNRFDTVTLFLHHIWISPIVVPIVCYLVWQHVGIATLAAMLVVGVQTIFVQVYLSNLQGKLRGKIANRTDERVKVMSELVEGVQVIKMYAWEKPFEKLVHRLRKLEVGYILRSSFVKGFSTALGVFTERFILFSAIATYVLIGGDIRAQTAFSLVQYFNVMQLACIILLPMGLAGLAETKVTLRRLEEFLLLEEKEPKKVTADLVLDSTPLLANEADEEEKVQEKPKVSALTISNVRARWQADASFDILTRITLKVEPGEFLGVAGTIVSGKSSLLQLILGELTPRNGTLSLGGARVSYASQEPWLFVATIRDNILFGLPYDPIRYKNVVAACALAKDFELLPYGDLTLVGERGVSLSGGQRARIGLARACYRQADIYLLDDPLSAVDTHVGKHIVSECVMGLLEKSTRILVTHQLHHLKNADKIIVLRHGVIKHQGTFDEVSQTRLFSAILEHQEELAGHHTKFRRNVSVMSHASSIKKGESIAELTEKQVEVEEISGTGRVSGVVYAKYFGVGSGWFLISFTVFTIILAQVITSVSDLWLTHWMNDVEAQYVGNVPLFRQSNVTIDNSTYLPLNITGYNVTEDPLTTTIAAITSATMLNYTTDVTLNNSTASDVVMAPSKIDNAFYIYIWAAAIFGCIIVTSVRAFLFLWVCMRSSIKLHNQMFSNILSATMRFFDTNPSGRILNRFSKDMGVVDEILPKLYLDAIQVFMVMTGILVMVAIVNPYMLLTTAVCAIFMYGITVVYLNTALTLKRMEGVSRSPVFSHVTATMSGLSTVRACQAEELLKVQFDDKQDVHTAAWYSTLVTNTAFSVWLSLVCGMYVIVVTYTFLVLDDGNTKSGNVGLAISQGLILVNMVQYGVKQATEVISQMVSVERVLQFTSLPQEETAGPSPPADWPQKARVVFKDLTLRYDKDADPVLKRLNIVIESGWKVGVVGRTGAGKSSLISALFRLAPIEGNVFIDNVDTGKIALKELRSKIAIIPQEPVLFSASLRYNLDPFDKYTDIQIWEALEQVEMKYGITKLSSQVASGGSNFSAGQRQLLCLARAALARNKLLVLDEATANVDPTTDNKIQKYIHRHFSDCTVIKVAHRLQTVADCDRIIVMEAGQIIECGHPHELLQDVDGPFTKMVNKLGPASEQSLRELASKAYSERNIRNTS
ncbi:hypothetical protein PYW08_013322 [Mythimna loreyi]|uniref:Uncharacterized protein n=1 Tax=Mythimna loreyi TaxID=667449 RepID=A0ACC2QH95_9NEOP|nr:hypothetical protein PYW08_013322 [Mythimna loreyi]